MKGKNLLVFQHTPWEGPGQHLLAAAAKHNVDLNVVKVWAEEIPDLAPYDALLVLGGGPNVDQEERYPFLVAEKAAIRKSLADNRPYLGICLGHQLLAEALGARIGKNRQVSVGFTTGHLTHAGHAHPLLQGLPDELVLFKWHGQAVLEPLPRHLSILATSRECAIEAISITGRPHILGVQNDNHAASPADVSRWLKHDADWLERVGVSEDKKSAIREDAGYYEKETGRDFAVLFANFLRLAAQT